MSAQTDFESLKQQIVDVVTKDPTVKYILLGWFNEEFVPKADYQHILEELRTMREDSNRRFEAADKRFDAVQQDMDKRFDAVQREIKELREDSNKRFEEAAAERRAIREDMNTRFQAVDKRFDTQTAELKKFISDKFGDMGQRWGEKTEEAFRVSLSSLIGEFFDGTVEKWQAFDADGFVHGGTPASVELDIVMSNGKCVVIEIKSSVDQGNVTIFERTARFYEQMTGISPDRKVLITPHVRAGVLEWATQKGVEILMTDQVRE